MYATVRVYAGTALADALVERESDVKALISGIEGFESYYLIKTSDGTASVSVYQGSGRGGGVESRRGRLDRREPAAVRGRGGAADLGRRRGDQPRRSRQAVTAVGRSARRYATV